MIRGVKSLHVSTRNLEKFGYYKKTKLKSHCTSGNSFYHSHTEKSRQFLQQSIVPTDHFQDSLPRLPVPELEKTCERYISALTPMFSPEQMQKTTQIVNRFKAEEGKELQEELVASNAKNKHTSYISEPWFDMYLKSRSPLVLNFNPFLAFKDDPKPQYNTQHFRATNIILSSLRFLKSLKANILEPEVFHLNPEKSDTVSFRKRMRLIPRRFAWYGAYFHKAFPLDMSQFKNLFQSTRIPCIGKDEIKTFPDSRHIAVLRRGHFYVFDVIDHDGNILPSAHIYDYINYILSDDQLPPTHPVSVLTTENRDTWAKAREHLKTLGNEETLHQIDSAIFLLSLDDEKLGDDIVNAAHHMLHGPAHNRWFDKSFTLILTGDGKAAINFEHAWGDGVAVLRYFNELFQDSTTNRRVGPKTSPANVDSEHCIKRLDFILDDAIKSTIQNAQENLKKSVGSLQLSVMKHGRLNRESIKGFNFSPDSIAQLGFQMAIYKLLGKFVATYESCSTSAYKHGRTDTVRPLTMETKRCTEAFHRATLPSKSELVAMMKECSKVHNQLTKEAAMGQGFDRHLFALRNIAEKKGQTLPALYQDPSYAEANHFILSTSTLFGPAFSGGGFAPVVKNGYGLAYGFVDNTLGCLVSSYSPDSDGAAFADALRKSYDQIYDVLSSP